MMDNEGRTGVSAPTGTVRSAARWAASLAALSAIQRLLLLIIYQPIPYPDTNAYLRLAEVLRQGTLNGYDGTRVPGYPAFLALLDSDPQSIWFAQMAMGWGIGLLLFYLAWRESGDPRLGALVGGLYHLIPAQFLFEANLLTETPTAFLIVFSLALLKALDERIPEWCKVLLAILMGWVASLAGLVRPLFFILPLWLLPFVLATPAGGWRARLLRGASFSLAPALLLGGWLGWMVVTFDMFSPTVMGGFHLVQHTGAYFDELPEEDALLRDIYLKYRDQRLAARGDQTNTIWEAIPEMSSASGLGFYNLSRELSRLSRQLIREHPDLYLQTAAGGWLAFWKAPVYWNAAAMDGPILRKFVDLWSLLGRGLSLLANLAFLLLSAGLLLSERLRRMLKWCRFGWAAVGLVWATSLVQTLVDHGDNPRFLIPLQMIVILVVVLAAWSPRVSGWRSER